MAIDRLPPIVRSAMARARQEAMRGGAAAGIRDLDAFALAHRESLPPESTCHLTMLAAELAFLDGDQKYAVEALTLDSLQIEALPAPVRVALVDNRLTAELLHPTQYDRDARRRTLEERDQWTEPDDLPRTLLDALRAAREGKHFDALPRLRSYVLQAYWRADWRFFRDAAREMALELLRLGDLAEAAFYAMLAIDETTATAVAAASLRPSGSKVLPQLLPRLIDHGALRQHARVVCTFIQASADAAPDDFVDSLARYLLRWVVFEHEFVKSLNVGEAAWEALGALGGRVSTPIADEALLAATSSREWDDKSGVYREPIVKACRELVSHASEDQLRVFTGKVLPLTSPERRGHDYHYVLSLLWAISARSPAAKELIVTALFSGTGAVAPASQMQLAKLLGKQLASNDALISFIDAFVVRIRNQVAILEPGAQAPPHDGFGAISFRHGEKQIVVQISAFGPAMHGVLAYADQLSKDAVERLVGAMQQMVSSQWNLIANKAELVFYVGEFAPYISPEQSRDLISVLTPIARGQNDDAIGRQMGNSADPLNRFRFDLGDPVDLQGLAIVALAKLEREGDATVTVEIQSIVAQGLAHVDGRVRKRSYVAATWLSKMSDAIVTGLLLGARDPIMDAAAAALGVFTSPKVLQNLAPSQVDYLVQAIDAASQSEDGSVRKQAAAVAAALVGDHKKTAGQSLVLKGVMERLRTDPLFSVRATINSTADER